MTLFAPSSAVGHPVPAVLQVHGGGWQHGSRLLSFSGSERPPTWSTPASSWPRSITGWLPRNPWPAQIVDVKCAVRYLRAHAADLGIDPDQIAALGTSAGGQLASLLGTTGPRRCGRAGPFPEESSAVDAVVDEYGPADFDSTDWPSAYGRHDPPRLSAPRPARPTRYWRSPVPRHTSLPATPRSSSSKEPTTRSCPLPSRSASRRQLRSAGVRAELVLVDHGRHGLETPGEVPSHRPSTR